MMDDFEKVTTGLELCTNISQDGCLMLCPYKDEQDETYPGFCELVLKRDALKLLEEQKKMIEALKIDLDILAKQIKWHSCNTCKANCDKRPGPGEQVRSNCIDWSDNDRSFVTTSGSTKERKR